MLRTIPFTRVASVLALLTFGFMLLMVIAKSGSIPAQAARPLFPYNSLLAEEPQIVFVSDRDGNREIYVMDADGGNPTRLTENIVVDDQPVWSPDHTKIAFASLRDMDWEIYVMDADGSNPTRLTNVPGTDFLPGWSPDGSQLTFVSARAEGSLEIYKMDADGGNPTRLTQNEVIDEQPTWAPNGTQIAFVSVLDGDNEIYVMNSDGTLIENITNNTVSDSRPMWSPDGNLIAFSTNRDGNDEIYVMEPNGANPLRLTNNAGSDLRPVWSQDSSQIAFFSNRDGNNEIYVMDADGANPVNLTNNAASETNPDWNPPGGMPPTPTSTATSTATATPTATSTTTAMPSSTPTATSTVMSPPACGGVYLASADTYLDQAQAATNFGQNSQLRLAKAGGNEVHTLLTFNLDNIPPGSVIQQAYIELALISTPTQIPYAIAVTDLTAWDENVATWTSPPLPGMTYSDSAYNVGSGTLQVDVTTLATRWANGELTPATLMLRPGEGLDYSVGFASSEGATGETQIPKLIVICGPPIVELPSAPPVPPEQQEIAIAQVEAASTETMTLYLDESVVTFASFNLPVPAEVGSEPVAQAEWFLNEHEEFLGIKEGEAFQLQRQSDDGEHIFFRQRHEGIPILAAELGIHLDEGAVTSLNGSYLADVTLPTIPELPAARAEELALINSEGDDIAGDTQLRYVDLSLLGIEEGDTHLTWQVSVVQAAHQAKLETVYVDAFTGAIIFRVPAFAHEYDLDLENGRGEFNDQLCGLFDDHDIDWNDLLPDSGTANHNNNVVYHYWRHNFGRDSYDNDGEQMEVNINVQYRPLNAGGPNSINASYSGGCDIFFYSPGMTTLDITGHEFSHAVDANEANLIYANQSGALDESFADIFGYFVDSGNFLLGEGSALARAPVAGLAGCSPTPAIRDMSNPPCYSDPDHVLGSISGSGAGLSPPSNNPTVTNDFGGVHSNSGIHNKAAALIIAGGTFNNYTIGGFNVGIGQAKAQRLFYNVFVNRLTSGSQFVDARNATIQEAIDLARNGTLGFNDSDVCNVRKAYAAVGIGFGDRNCDAIDDAFQPDLDADKDGVRDNVDVCPNKWNPGQSDIDGDKIGDSCDPDLDGDGRANNLDNCQWVSNAGWADWNGNGEGDACDDSDEDGTVDSADNCRDIENPGQENIDFDRFGDLCDPDIDNDSWVNGLDNCPVNYNFGQEDTTEVANGLPADKVGDTCDFCPLVSSADNRDSDRDGLGNPCDDNDDNDKWLDGNDNCPDVANDDQLDWDKNGIGYACDQNERVRFGLIIKGINEQYITVDNDFTIPIPVCPECGQQYLPNLWESVINVALPFQYKAVVIDSYGTVVAKSVNSSLSQSLSFNPALFAAPRQIIGTASDLSTDGVLAATVGAEPVADEIRYYLRIVPVAGTDLSQSYPIDLSVEEHIEEPKPLPLYLPTVSR